MTHKGSNWEMLVEKLKEDQRFDFFQTGQTYDHPDDLQVLLSNIHRRDNAAAIWCDVILHNKDFTCRALRESCQFIYFQGPLDIFPIEYAYRIQGMKWYHKKTGGIWLLEQDLESPISKGDSFLSAIYG